MPPRASYTADPWPFRSASQSRGALALAGFLAVLSGAPPAVRVIPPDDPNDPQDPPELCIPQTVTGADAVLQGHLGVLDTPMVGQPTRIRAYSAVPPLAQSISLTAIQVVEGCIGSGELEATLKLLLAGTRIQISHTGNGTPAEGTPYTVKWQPPPSYKYEELCLEPEQPAPICSHWDPVNGVQQTFRTLTPVYTSSYIDFGPGAEQAGAPPALPLPIEVFEREIPLEKRALFLALQYLAIGIALDIDEIRLLANNVHIDLGNLGRWSASIGGGLNLSTSLDSDDPCIKCEGHWTVKAGYIFTVSQGWSDNLCPDFDLSRMKLSVKLVPTVIDGKLTVGDVQATAELEPEGVQSDLIDFFVGATTIGEARIFPSTDNYCYWGEMTISNLRTGTWRVEAYTGTYNQPLSTLAGSCEVTLTGGTTKAPFTDGKPGCAGDAYP